MSEFYRVASRLLLSATVFLALGLSADIYLVVSKITGNSIMPVVLATAVVLLGLWHLWPWWLLKRPAELSPRRKRAG